MSFQTLLRPILRALCCLAAFSAFSTGLRAGDDAKPNILFLFADDQRPDTIGALGNPTIQTPTLDALVRRGFVFHNAYCLGSDVGAVCLPSRNMLMSGRAYFRWQGRQAPADEPNLPAAMKQAGYFTYHHGKKGNSATAIQALFDVNKYVDDKVDRTSKPPGKVIVDEAITFLSERDSVRPFFMYLAFSNPHDPRVAPKQFLDLYDRQKIPLPKNYLPQHPFNNGEMTVRDEQLAPWPRTEDEIRKHLHEYYATISALDFHIGRLIESLKALNVYENTIIIYSADHGLAIGSHGLMGKQSLYEHSMKAPLIFAGPGIPQGETKALVYLLDLFPTLCSLGGAEIPPDLDGKNLKPIIAGEQRQVRDSLFLAYRDVQRAVRVGSWKLIRYPQIHRTQLFDLSRDPDELWDLAADPEHAARLGKLEKALIDWQQKLGDNTPWSAAKPADSQFVPPVTGSASTSSR